MQLINFTCPGCGAPLDIDAGLKRATCQFCGTSFSIANDVSHVTIDDAEQAGYEFEKGRQRAQREQAGARSGYVGVPPGNVGSQAGNRSAYVGAQGAQGAQQVQQQDVKKRRTWLWVLGWIFMFPVPLTIIMLNNESVKDSVDVKLRYAIIAVAWLVYLGIVLSD